MNSPTVLYGGVGALIGAFANVLFAGSPRLSDLLIGALLGLFIGVLLALSRYMIWGGK